MNVRCPGCETVYRVDPQKIPAGGVRARCAQCAHVFRVEPTEEAAGAAVAAEVPERGLAEAEAVAEEEAAAMPAATEAASLREPAAAPPPVEEEVATIRPGRAGAEEAEPAGVGAPAAPAHPQPAAPAPEAPHPFGRRDPAARARRLARALVSDIVAYFPDRRERALRKGTLRAEFRDEIRKSWDEYVAQVGEEMARKTPYFRAALNDILADGQQVF